MNNEMQNYDFIEGSEFTALMPKVLEQAPATVGVPEEAVAAPFMGMNARGTEPMEVVDVEAFYGEGDGGNTGGNILPDGTDASLNSGTTIGG